MKNKYSLEGGLPLSDFVLKLKFFRDNLESTRRKVFKKLKAIPVDYDDFLSEAFQVSLFHKLVKDGKSEQIRTALNEM